MRWLGARSRPGLGQVLAHHIAGNTYDSLLEFGVRNLSGLMWSAKYMHSHPLAALQGCTSLHGGAGEQRGERRDERRGERRRRSVVCIVTTVLL